MRALRPVIGALVLLAVFAAVGGGLYLLYENEGGGIAFSVTFREAKNLEPGSNVIYQDQVVGRVVSVSRDGDLTVVGARLGSTHAAQLREHSRFWVQDPLGKSLLCFDNPLSPGAARGEGSRFKGLESRPEPDRMPPPRSRLLESKPVWLCELRVSATIGVSAESVRDERRKSAAAVVRSEGERAWVLAAAWALSFQGELRSQQLFVEFAGGETCTAELLATVGEFVLLHVAHTAWRGAVAPLWPQPLDEGQGVAVVNFKGEYYSGQLRGGVIDNAGSMEGGYLALVDGANVAGFALPAVGDSGVKWCSAASALVALRAALK